MEEGRKGKKEREKWKTDGSKNRERGEKRER